MKAALITIGDEILYGQTVDTNSAWMATELNLLGIDITEVLTIPDETERIREALDRSLSQADIVLITGGLGPTRDDKTKPTLTDYFDTELEFNEQIYKDILELFNRRGIALLDRNKRQAEVPKACTPIRNANGTAPGMWFDRGEQVVVSMPGVPYEMKAMVTDFVLPRLQEKFDLPIVEHRFVQTAGVGESRIAEKLESFEDNLPKEVSMAYLPGLGYVKLRLTAKGKDRDRLIKMLDDLVPKLIDEIPGMVYGTGRDLTLEAAIGNLLRDRGLTLGTAESCTGGFIAHKITSIAGSSDYFLGSIVSYSNEAKMNILGVQKETLEQHGAVSEEVVREMVAGAQNVLKVDCAIAVSGIAGPTGGTEEKPVGTVWVAIAVKNRVYTKLLQLGKKRQQNIELTTILSLNLFRRFLMGLVDEQS